MKKGKGNSESQQKRREREFNKGTQRQNIRRADLEQNRKIITLCPEEGTLEAPFIVVVSGGKESGKTTVTRSLVWRYTKKRLKELIGPATVFGDKNRRIILVECENSVESMVDLAKVADLVVLVIDSTVGLSVENFEFMAILKAHGLCKVVGVMTKLDLFEESEKRRVARKSVKVKFMNELGFGTKMFYFTGLERGIYKEREIYGLSRFVVVSNPHPLQWRTQHGVLLVDKLQREEDVPEEGKTEKVAFYGYLRGKPFRHDQSVCIPGLGTFVASEIATVSDPCPLQEKNPKKIRKIVERRRVLYAPFSNIEGVFSDEKATYIDVQEVTAEKVDFPFQAVPTVALSTNSVIEMAVEEKEQEQDQELIKKEEAIKIDEETEEEESEEEFSLEKEETLTEVKKCFLYGEESEEETSREMKKERLEKRFEKLMEAKSSSEGNLRQTVNTAEDLEDLETRKHFGGYPGEYLKIVLEGVPKEFLLNFNPEKALLLGAVETTQKAFLCARLQRHRFSPRILKTREPLIVSVGWQRFQTCPVFSLEDPTRNKYLKYTPEKMHCLATFYGPVHEQGAGLCAFKLLETPDNTFRVSAVGSIVEVKSESNIKKKLKLLGSPLEVQHHAAVISKMFTSGLEAVKFEGALLKTTGGIRGKIKKAVGENGCFRASFEDTIPENAIVFLRTWHLVTPPSFYNPMTEHLGNWLRMRTNKELRDKNNLSVPLKESSFYKPVIRSKRRNLAKTIPSSLLKQLPFKDRPQSERTEITKYLEKRRPVLDFDEIQKERIISQLKRFKRKEVKAKKEVKEKEEKEVKEEKEKFLARKAENIKLARKERFKKNQLLRKKQ